MTDAPKADYKDTVFLPQTAFPMKAGLPQKEPQILARWQEQNLYEKLRTARRGREKFILHDGPPYANGDMHIGHALNHILKDMVVRTQSLKGKDAPYVPGWDCHGLPIEWKVEEQYRKKKLNKDEVPVEEFRAECRAYAQHWVDVQREQLKRLGINGDWDNPYLTMDFEAEATIVAELMKFAETGQLYRGAKPVMWSPVEKTALAEAEVEYEDITSTQVDVAFEIVDSQIEQLKGAYAVIWTTTPWTIPVNQALAYGPDVEYVVVRVSGVGTEDEADQPLNRPSPLRQLISRRFLVAADLVDVFKERVAKTVGATSPALFTTVVWEGTGADLAGTTARHPMAKYVCPCEGRGPEQDNAEPTLGPRLRGDTAMQEFFSKPRPFLPGDFVTTDAGTGLVHMAPDHGEDDFDLCKAYGINPVFAVEGDGKYRADWAWLGGQGSVINPKFNAPDGPICSDLREAGALLAASADFQHSYPHSWRSKAKVIYRCTPQWFIPMDRVLTHISPKTKQEKRWENEGGAINPAEEDICAAPTLRQLALDAIADTRFVPDKGRNRIGSMVEGRPDWVISRQRAWGVPITLFVDRKSGEYLCDPAVNARIVEGIRAKGVDAWSDAAAQSYLGDAYSLEDYERVTDILDVWFDSGCTHAFVLQSGKWPDLTWPADLYLEGSDQHRGWFQSSLLESCGTRGRAPYDAVLTHGFTMDAKGMKMSKSLGNTISPLDLMRDYGADIIRLWALSVDFTEDHRIGKEILAGVGDQYRKLRNSFRYMLGALGDFDESERVPVAEMPELERYVLHLLTEMDGKLSQAVDDFDYNSYTRLLSDFANNDLSAFFFDIRKDCLYCDAKDDPKRRAYRTVLDILFHALVRYAAPVLVFTAEEVWQSRYPDADSVHLLEWPELPALPVETGGAPHSAPDEDAFAQKWADIRALRQMVNEAIEPLRREKTVRSSNEAEVMIGGNEAGSFDYLADVDMAEICIVSSVGYAPASALGGEVKVTPTSRNKCGRCWRHLPDVTEDGALCGRCEDVLDA